MSGACQNADLIATPTRPGWRFPGASISGLAERCPSSHTSRPVSPDAAPRHRDRRREALTHVGGTTDVWARSPELGAVLEQAFAVSNQREAVLRHVHGFHSYPARMHPDTAAELVRRLSGSDDVVLDPFCGSGTVLVEARLAGRRAAGYDANPLAIELSWLKTGGLGEEHARLGEVAVEVVDHAEQRRAAKAGPTRRYGPRDRELFDPHVLLELDGLRHGIREVRPAPPVARALLLVLSSLLTKVSRQPGDTATRATPRRLAGGFVIRLFRERASLLSAQLAEFDQRLPAGVPSARPRLGDARQLRASPDRSVQLIVTSPPYPGVYDYHSHHLTRLRWLGIDAQRFEQAEVGARRRFERLDYSAALAAWRREFGGCLAAMARVLRPDGVIVLAIADTVLGDRAAFAEDMMVELVSRHGLDIVGRASQTRPHFHGPTRHAYRRRPRREHLLALRLATSVR